MALRFDELSPREFEELCLALLHAEGYSTRHVGAAGSDGGWDGRATAPDGRLWCVQCKRVANLDAGTAAKELLKVLDNPEGEMPDVWALMAPRDLGAKFEGKLVDAAGGRCEIQCVGKSDLETRLHAVPRVRDRFFAGNDPKAQIVYLSACKADRDVAAALRRDLQWNLRQLVGSSWNVVWDDPSQSDLPMIPDAASWGIALVSPEALADLRLTELWRTGLCAGSRNGKRDLLALSVAPSVPWPDWLSDDFERLDLGQEPDAYRPDLAAIISKWIGTTEKNLASEISELEGPGQPAPRLPAEISSQLIAWLEPLMKQKAMRRLLANELGLGLSSALDDFPTPALQASAALILSRDDDDPIAAALRLIANLQRALDEDESTERLRDLQAIAKELERQRQSQPDASMDRGLLPSWLRKVQRDHERLVDYFQQRHELDLLDKVYVELEMLPHQHRPERDASEKKAEQPFTAHPKSLRDVLALDPNEHDWVTRRWVVRGDPGAGKTTLLRHLACQLARDAESQWVPVFQSLPVLLRSRERLLDRIERIMAKETGREGLAKVFDREGQEGRLLLLLDGLDEVGPELREEAESLLRRLDERWPTTPIVVSTRPIGYRRFSQSFRELQLLPLDRPRRLDFLAAWFGRADGSQDTVRAESALKQLDASGLDELAGNPLYLTLMAMLLEQNQSPDRNRAELYKQVFQLLLEGKHKHGQHQPIERPELVRQALRRLAYTMTVDNRDTEAKGLLEERLYRPELDAIREQLKKVPRWDGPLRLFLDDLSEKVGILGPHDGEDADWRFWHRTFKEALTAENLAALPREELLQRAETLMGEESRWAEPFALVTGQVDEPDALVLQLVESNRTLGLRALATAQGISDDTLDKVLALTDDSEARSKVFEQIPALLDDADRALKLIDRLRLRNPGGNDLFWLHHAIGEVGRRWENFAERARHLQTTFYDHLPAPPAHLFGVDLWCRIPEGRLLMGSPKDEEGRYDDEGPQHEVVIKSPFRLAAVPVTQAQYAVFEPDHRSEFKGAQRPVDSVTWYQAMAFCDWLASHSATAGARLPTEEEWEYACRAGSTGLYSNENKEGDLEEVAWYSENSDAKTHDVGQKAPNRWGLYDMHGNVWDWTLSPWTSDYSEQASNGSRTIDPATLSADLAAPIPRDHRVIRGGSCWIGARDARSAFRVDWVPGNRGLNQGFRVLLPFAPSEH